MYKKLFPQTLNFIFNQFESSSIWFDSEPKTRSGFRHQNDHASNYQCKSTNGYEKTVYGGEGKGISAKTAASYESLFNDRQIPGILSSAF